MLIARLTILILFCLVGQSHAVVFLGDRIQINDDIQIVPSEGFDVPIYRKELERELLVRERVEKVDDNQPRYLYVFDLANSGAQKEILVEVSGTIVDEIDLYIYDQDEMVYFDVTGYFYPRETQSYLFTIPIPKGSTYKAVMEFKSRYFSGPVNIYLENPDDFHERNVNFMALVYVCLGGMIFLGLYNLLLYVGVKDSSYFFYSLYLFCTVVGWASVFAVLVKHFNVNEVGYALLPFYLGQMFSVLFYIRFLNLTVEKNPHLLRLSYGIVFVDLIYLGIFPWLDNYYVFYKSLMHISSIWLAITLFAGIYRLRQGFVPARFFVLGFSMIAIGGVISILPGLGVDTGIESFYLITLICQALDMLFLAVALADRINVLRKEKEVAQRHAYKKDLEILDVEQQANQALIESNLMLKEALDISELEGKKKQNFLMVASHELKTPLNAMVQTASDLNDSSEKGKIIQQGVERLALVVDEVTLFSQLASGGVKAIKNTLDVGVLIKEIIDVQKIFNSQLDVDVLGVKVEVDRYLVSNVLRSLIDNACKYSDQGKVKIEFRFERGSESASWIIEDDGFGLDLNNIDKLVEPFEQDSKGLNRAKEGMGLGLYVVKHAVEVMGGELVFAKSDELGGTRVTVTVPAKLVEKSEEVHAVFKSALVVEDNPVNAVVLTSILDKLAITCDVVENGEEAVSIVNDNHYDIIFMDLQMPVMDGFEATRQLMLDAYPAPIVAVTAESESGSRERCFSLGMADVILKPVRVMDIKGCLEKLSS